MSSILFAALASISISMSFVNSLVLIAVIMVVAAFIVAYVAVAYKATPTIEWTAADVEVAPIAKEEYGFLKDIKRCKDGVWQVSFEANGKIYHRRMPNSIRTQKGVWGKRAYAEFILKRYAHLFIEEVEVETPIEEVATPIVEKEVDPLHIESYEAMEAGIERGDMSGPGWHRRGDFVTRYRGDASYIRLLKVGGTLRLISDHAAPC